MNRKITALIMALVLGLSSAAFAKHKDGDHKVRERGGYIGGNSEIITVKQALTMPDDSDVTLRGQIEKRIKKDKYQFKDESGTIIVEIDKDVWDGQTVGPNDTVTITGELDKDDNRTTVDVERLIKK